MIDPALPEDAPVVTGKMLRQFAVLCLGLFGGLAWWIGVVRDNVSVAVVLAGAAILVGSVGLAHPEGIRPIYMALMALTAPIGRVVSPLVLASLFYGVFTPLGLLFRLFGRDALHVRLPDRPSHWEVKPAVTDARDYLRQS